MTRRRIYQGIGDAYGRLFHFEVAAKDQTNARAFAKELYPNATRIFRVVQKVKHTNLEDQMILDKYNRSSSEDERVNLFPTLARETQQCLLAGGHDTIEMAVDGVTWEQCAHCGNRAAE